MKELLEYLTRGLVAEPDSVQVTETREDDGSLVLELSVAPDDYGSVIENRRVFVDIVDA